MNKKLRRKLDDAKLVRQVLNWILDANKHDIKFIHEHLHDAFARDDAKLYVHVANIAYVYANGRVQSKLDEVNNMIEELFYVELTQVDESNTNDNENK